MGNVQIKELEDDDMKGFKHVKIIHHPKEQRRILSTTITNLEFLAIESAAGTIIIPEPDNIITGFYTITGGSVETVTDTVPGALWGTWNVTKYLTTLKTIDKDIDFTTTQRPYIVEPEVNYINHRPERRDELSYERFIETI